MQLRVRALQGTLGPSPDSHPLFSEGDHLTLVEGPTGQLVTEVLAEGSELETPPPAYSTVRYTHVALPTSLLVTPCAYVQKDLGLG